MRALKDLIRREVLQILFLQETKLKARKIDRLKSCLGFERGIGLIVKGEVGD